MLLLLLSLPLLIQSQSSPQSIFDARDLYMTKQYIDAITAYGPGVGVFAPYSYVDFSYDNVPFIGKIIPVLGKEGTSSRLGISPFYPAGGNPSNPVPPLYRARPLPLHIPEPVDVVAVPLDEEALHGEPLFPKELVLPELMEMAGKAPSSTEETEKTERRSQVRFLQVAIVLPVFLQAAPESPFGAIDTEAFEAAEKAVSRPARSGNAIDDDDLILWPASRGFSSMSLEGLEENILRDEERGGETTIIDGVREKSTKMDEMAHEAQNEPVAMGDGRGGRRRIRRLAEILAGR
ncbi:hypothetical protein PENTCL1PPCAC_30636, partial [Pristionchus entomophagus]